MEHPGSKMDLSPNLVSFGTKQLSSVTMGQWEIRTIDQCMKKGQHAQIAQQDSNRATIHFVKLINFDKMLWIILRRTLQKIESNEAYHMYIEIL